MVAQIDATYYFADSLERKRFNCSFLKKKLQRKVQKKIIFVA